MLLVAGTLDFHPAHRDEAIAACVAIHSATRPEEGCLHYAFTSDLEYDGRLHVIEKWESQAALDAHLATPHVAAFRQAVAGIGIHDRSFTKYEIASEAPVG